MAEEEYAYGSGNGGRSCTGVSCLAIILSTVFLAFLYIVPLATEGLIGPKDLFSPWTDTCGWSCCCLGSIGLIVGVVLIFTDDPEKAKRKAHERQLAARKRAAQRK
jgi:hypothetical protein